MKVKDLKVGMVFVEPPEEKRYFKIIKITEKSIFYECLNIETDWFGCSNHKKEDFPIHIWNLIDKLPLKIVEVGEEVPVYIPILNYNMLLNERSVSGGSFPQLTTEFRYSINDEYVELCKIKRTIKKKLNFNWDTGKYD